MKRGKFGSMGLMAIAVAGAANGEPSNSASSKGLSAAVQQDQLERNKAVVTALFAIINGTSVEDIAKIDSLVAEDYIQHNPLAGQGREGLRQFLYKIVPAEPKELPPSDMISVNFIAEGDYVVRQEMRKNGMLVDIFRIRDGLLQEHWDAFRFAPGAKRIPGF